MRILIIEDDPVQSFMLNIQLNEIGFNQVDIANDLNAVAEYIKSSHYDLVLCDIRMPDVDGVTLLSEYLDPESVKSVIIISAVDDYVINLTKGMCIQMGYANVLTINKPVVAGELKSKIESIVKKKDVKYKFNSSVIVTEDVVFESFIENWFSLEYQPQFSFRTGKLVGIEALARIQHPELGTVYPNSFISKIESMCLMERFYTYVLTKATQEIKSLNSEITLSINITQDILSGQIYDITTRICNENSFSLSRLTLELTEENAFSSNHKALANLARLSLAGVRFSIDDFGTGYASLAQLIDLPISELKIDRLFISQIIHDYRLQQLVKASVLIAHSLGMNCVAEGVEDSATWEFLKEIGIDTCQGFYTGKPMGIIELEHLYRLVSRNVNTEIALLPSITKVIVFDDNTIRGQALVRMLNIEFSSDIFVLINSINEFYTFNNTSDIDYVIIEGESLSHLSENDRVVLKDKLKPTQSIILSETKSSNALIDFDNRCIHKSHSIVDTVKNIKREIIELNEKRENIHTLKFSKRENDIAQLLLAGFTNKYIAYELGISQKTVSTFKGKILAKAGIKSIIELSRLMPN